MLPNLPTEVRVLTRKEEDQYVVAELNKAGVHIDGIYDLVNSRTVYPEAIPVLVSCLSIVRDRVIKEGIVRAITVKEAKGKADKALIHEFRNIPPEASELQNLKWAIGNALSVVATDAVFDDLAGLVTTIEHGKAREMIVIALGKMKNPTAGEVLTRLLSDEELVGFVAKALAKLKYHPALPKLQSLLDHSKPWVKKELEKTIKKLSKDP
jgi:hypothetical protein